MLFMTRVVPVYVRGSPFFVWGVLVLPTIAGAAVIQSYCPFEECIEAI